MKILPLSLRLILLFVFTFQHSKTSAQENDKKHVPVKIESFIFKPVKREATAERIAQLNVPEGFKVEMLAGGLGKARMMAVHTDGSIYLTIPDSGIVLQLKDQNGDGKIDIRRTVIRKPDVHGIAIHQNHLYVVAIKQVYRADIRSDGSLSEPLVLVNDLPDGGQHPNRTIGFGPDGKMYISIGSTCNSCAEPNKEHATMLVADADGTNRRIYARGLRNTVGFAWHPQTQELWGFDNGMDLLGDDEPREELNKIVENGDYGWPLIYDNGKISPTALPVDATLEAYEKSTRKPVLLYQAHAAPVGMAFYNGSQFPASFTGDAFVALHGSWNHSKAVGYKVVRVRFTLGQPAQIEDFLTGFLIENNTAHFGRVAGVAVHTDGSLLITDDANGVLYRIRYVGN